MLNSSKRIFYLFLTIHTILWTCVLYLTHNVLSFDAMEAVQWGELLDFGTNKHPPLSGWLAAGFYDLSGQYDIVLYLLGQICILIGFIYVYKLAKNFFNDEKAFCTSMILEGCTYYTFFIFRDIYNCNILLFALWPMLVYYFYDAVKSEKLKTWVIFGILSGLAFLGKYQIVFLFLGLLIYLIFEHKEQFKKKGMYIAIACGLAVILPHVIFLVKTNFFSFAYMLERTESETHNLPQILEQVSRIFYPFKFVFGQVFSCAVCILIFLLTALQAKNINIEKLSKDGKFLLFVFLAPIILQGLMGMITGNRVPSVWGSIMVSMFGIVLFYFFPVKFKENTFKFFSCLVFAVMIMFNIGIFLYSKIQTDMLISFPKETVMRDFENILDEKPLKYVDGNMNYSFFFRMYHKDKPTPILDTFGAKNIWIDENDIKKSGLLVADKKSENVRKKVFERFPDFNNEIEIAKYSYQICNVLKSCENYDFYYTVIKPDDLN